MSRDIEKLDFAYELFFRMQEDNIGYIFRGRFDQEITDNILLLTESNLNKDEESSKMKKRVYSILVEGLQNITRHQDAAITEDEIDDSMSFGFFVIQKKNEKYFITTGNVIENSNIKIIQDLLDKINKLDKAELKLYYKQVLEEGSLSQKGGAGLGLIDMARKSGNKLIYEFRKINDNSSFFYLHTMPTLSKQKDEDLDEIAKKSLVNIQSIHDILNDADLRLIFNGSFNQESLLNLLASIKGQITGSANIKNKVFYIIVEMLQNIIKHGTDLEGNEERNPGVFFIGEKGNKYFITTGNYIKNENINKLKSKLDSINELDFEELENFYIKSLFNFEIDDSKESGLGVIDLRIKSESTLNYYFQKIDDNFSFFSLQTNIIIK